MFLRLKNDPSIYCSNCKIRITRTTECFVNFKCQTIEYCKHHKEYKCLFSLYLFSAYPIKQVSTTNLILSICSTIAPVTTSCLGIEGLLIIVSCTKGSKQLHQLWEIFFSAEGISKYRELIWRHPWFDFRLCLNHTLTDLDFYFKS